jgi:hypothetical protein
LDADTNELQQAIFAGKIQRARAIPAARKIADAATLFDETLALMRTAIATDNPTFGPDQVAAEVARRLSIARRLDEAGIYGPAGTIDDQP